MATTLYNKSEIPGQVSFMEGNNDLPKIVINTAWSTAELYLHGAHLTHFQKKGEPPILWMSQLSRFQADTPIRGGIPVIFPWFGPRDGQPSHGFARLQDWELREITQMPDGRVGLRLNLLDSVEAALLTPFAADLWVTVGQNLEVELVVTNSSIDEDLTFEDCFHTYFTVADVTSIAIAGLSGVQYLDQSDKMACKTDSEPEIKITRETDRIYHNSTEAVEIRDFRLKRRIRIDKSGSRSTVVWNPWVAKSQRMPDFGNDEYLQMVCVESGNIGDNNITLSAGSSASLKIALSTEPL